MRHSGPGARVPLPHRPPGFWDVLVLVVAILVVLAVVALCAYVLVDTALRIDEIAEAV